MRGLAEHKQGGNKQSREPYKHSYSPVVPALTICKQYTHLASLPRLQAAHPGTTTRGGVTLHWQPREGGTLRWGRGTSVCCDRQCGVQVPWLELTVSCLMRHTWAVTHWQSGSYSLIMDAAVICHFPLQKTAPSLRRHRISYADLHHASHHQPRDI